MDAGAQHLMVDRVRCTNSVSASAISLAGLPAFEITLGTMIVLGATVLTAAHGRGWS
jgi:hypothetical protein